MRVVADSHAIFWYGRGAPELSKTALDTLVGAEIDGGIVISVATLIDLWYVTVTTKAILTTDLDQLRDQLQLSETTDLHPIDVEVTAAYTTIDRGQMKDPWDRFIVATAKALNLPLVTRDRLIQTSGLVSTIW